MRIIPKKVKVKNTVWKCYSMVDVIVALVVFAIIFIAITAGNWVMAVILGLLAVVMFMPTPDGIYFREHKIFIRKEKIHKRSDKCERKHRQFNRPKRDKDKRLACL